MNDNEIILAFADMYSAYIDAHPKWQREKIRERFEQLMEAALDETDEDDK